MTAKNGVGVTVISHDSENETRVNKCEQAGCYSRVIHYKGVSVSQLASLTNVSTHCEQFIKYECLRSRLLKDGMEQLRFGDTNGRWPWQEAGYHTLGKFICYGTA